MVQTAHGLRRRCERLAGVGPERVEPIVTLGAYDQYDRIRAAVRRRHDRRARPGDGTTPGGLDCRRGVGANFQRNQTVRRFPSRAMRALALQNKTPSAALQTAGEVMAMFVVTRALANAPPTPPRLSRSRR
jgi:hypothetical protein